MVAPFPKLSFEAFRSLLERHYDCSLHPLLSAGELTDIDGTPAPAVHYFERDLNGVLVQAVVVVFDEAQYMTPTVIRSTCAALHIIDLKHFDPYL